MQCKAALTGTKHPEERHVCTLWSMFRSHPAPRRGPEPPHVLEDTPSARAAFTRHQGLRGLNKNLFSSSWQAWIPESSLLGLQMVIFCVLTCPVPCTCLCLNLPFLQDPSLADYGPPVTTLHLNPLCKGPVSTGSHMQKWPKARTQKGTPPTREARKLLHLSFMITL